MKSNILNNLYQYFVINSKCPSKNHYGIPIYFCLEPSCNKGYICSQCLTEDTEHFTKHVKNFIALDTKKNFFYFFGIQNLEANSYDFEYNINFLKNAKNLKYNKKINDARNLYEFVNENIINIFNDSTKNNWLQNKNKIDKYITDEKEKEKKINEFINNKINSFIRQNDKYKIKELIEEIKPYLNYLKEKNKLRESNENNKLEKINSLLNEEIQKIIEKCINIYIEPIKDNLNLELNNLNNTNIKDNLNITEKNKSFYEGSINNISCIKTESNLEPDEFESKININNNANNIHNNQSINNQNIIKNSINDSFFKKIEEEYENKNLESGKRNNIINKLPFNNYEFQQREKISMNNKEKEKSNYDELFENNNLYLKPTISAANNFQFYNSNNDIVNELEIKLNKIHNNNLLNKYLKKSFINNTPKSNNSAINISINNFHRKNSSNNINNININNIYQSQRERKDYNNIMLEGEKLNIKTKNNINRLNKTRNQIGNLIK